MSKGIILADLHNHDFRTYNIKDSKYRLKQSEKLAEWISILNPEWVMIAGDINHVHSPPPEVILRSLKFFSTLGCPVYITHGQHDITVRKDHTQFKENTYLSVADLLDNVTYLHREMINIGGLDFYFKGWENNYNIDEIEKCDILIGHTNPIGARSGSSEYMFKSGTSLDLSKFKIAFLGDIHRHQVLHDGKIVIPGTALQNSYSDYPNPGIIEFNTNTLEWNHIPTPVQLTPDYKRLQFIVTEDTNTDPYIISKKPSKYLPTDSINILPMKTIDPPAILDNIISNYTELKNIHSQVSSKVSTLEESSPNLLFKLETLDIKNGLMINELHLDFNDIAQVALICGNNGIGKSSLIKVIEYALGGKGYPKDFLNWDENFMQMSISFQYDGHHYEITRGINKKSGFTTFEIDGEDKSKGTSSQTKDFIAEELKFINYVDLMVFNQGKDGFLAKYNYQARITLLSKLLGLTFITKIYEESNKLLSVYRESIASAKFEIDSINTSIETLNGIICEDIPDKSEIKIQINKLESNKRSIQEIYNQARLTRDSYHEKSDNYRKMYSEYTREIESRKSQLEDIEKNICYACKQIIESNKLEEMKAQIIRSLKYYEKRLDSIAKPNMDQADRFQKIINTTSNKIDEIQSKINNLFGEVALSEQAEKNRKKLKELQDKLLAIKPDYEYQLSEIEKIEQYLKIVAPGGELVTNILSKVAESISNDVFRIKTFKELKSGEIRPDFAVYLKDSRDKWVNYENLSGGQKKITDLYVLTKLFEIVGGCGLLMLDESLECLDPYHTELAISIIQNISIGNCLIISHDTEFPYYDRLINVTYDNGSQYSVT